MTELTPTPRAAEEINQIALTYGLNPTELTGFIVKEAHASATRTLLSKTPWFRKHTQHCVNVVRILKDEGVFNLHMVVDLSTGQIFATDEVVLSDDYFAERLIEETLIDIKLTLLK